MLAAAVAALAPAAAVAQVVVINEFLAINDGGLRDAGGDASDWVEIHNQGPGPVDLAGWHLTDDPFLPFKYRLPDLPGLVLEPCEYLVVFASGKDRVIGSEIHANFSLAGEGEYLALVEPDGVTVAHEYGPRYPRQRADISYGLSTRVDTLVPQGVAARYRVPADASEGLSWTLPGFEPGAAWKSGVTGIGYAGGEGEPLGPPPASRWTLGGTLEDDSGPNDGVFAGGAPDWVEGHDGTPDGALRFDGQDDYVQIEQNALLPAYHLPAYTVAMWVRGLPQPDRRVWSEGSSSSNTPLFTIGTHQSGSGGEVDIFIRFAGGASPGHVISDSVAFDGTWHHIAWVDAGGNAALYIDGIRDLVDFSYAKQDMALDITSIGCVLRASPCCFFAGDIDDVAVWDEALGPEAIEAIVAAGPGGSPYSRWIDTDVAGDLAGVNTSVYVRVPFEVEDPAGLDALSLRLRYDDGLVAWLNGVEVARRNAPAALSWNAAATADRPAVDAVAVETVDLSDRLGLLLPGTNLLALQGLDAPPEDEGFLLLPELVGTGSLSLEPRYFSPPTPGAPNDAGFVDFVEDTKFSVDRGFFEEPIDVEITTATPGAEIRYTVDGSAPARTHGDVYGGPIRIDGTAVLRAAAFRDGFEPSNVDTQTYIFLEDVIRQRRPAGYPTTWAGLAADYDMDPEICTNTASLHYQATIREDLMAIPTMSIALDPEALMGTSLGIYTHPLNRGSAWERPGSVEYFAADAGDPEFQVDCGVRMQGGSSARPIEGKHSFRLVFKSLHGPSKLRFSLFDDSPVDEFDTLVLRCCSTDSWHFKDGGSRYRRWDSQYIRDLFMRDSQRAMGQLSSHGTYVHLYVNGMYWGLYNPSERPDDSFNALHQGGRKEDWDVVKDFTESFRGDLRSWNEMMTLAGAGLATEASYQRIQGNNPDGTPNPAYPVLLDVENLIDYMILHLWGCSEDWPHHNWYAARNRTGLTGGWRFFVWDQEIVMDFVFRNRIDVSNSGSPAYLYSRLRQNPEFRLRFADRVHEHLFHDGALTVEEARRRWLTRATEIDRAIVGESARWGDFRDDVPDPSNSPAELYTRERHWVVEREKVLDEYIPESHRLALARFRQGGLYPAIEAPELVRHGGEITPGFLLEMAAPRGTIHYTLDGSDPRLPGGAVSPGSRVYGVAAQRVLLGSGAPATALVPANGDLGLAWTTPAFDDAGWRRGATGVGYERTSGFEDLIGLDVGDVMDGVRGTVYARIAFEADDIDGVDALTLRMKYDDGFIAYLNGEEVARRNAPDDPAWDSSATTSHGDAEAMVFEDIDISDSLGFLRESANLLALHGLNSSPTSSDMLILPEITAGSVSGTGAVLDGTTLVKARALDGAEWSALTEAVFFVDPGLRITEIMYHPADGGFPVDADLRGVRFTRGIEFEFSGSAVESLAPGEIAVVVENLDAFAARYDAGRIRVAGEYAGKLSNRGEQIELLGALGEVIQRFAFDDAWHPATDGEGPSLVIADSSAPRETWGLAASWRPSAFPLGSPGIDESGGPQPLGLQRPGDANRDGDLNLSDGVRILIQLFVDGTLPLPCEGGIEEGGNREVLDANGDLRVNLSDPVHLLTYLFNGGPPHVRGTACIPVEGCPSVCR